MKNLCKTLAYIELILGVIGGIVLANTLGVRMNYKTYSVERDTGLTFAIFLSTMLCVVTLWAILCAFSEILKNQEELLSRSENSVKPEYNIKPICGIPIAPVSNTLVSPAGTPDERLQAAHPTTQNMVVNNDEWNEYDTWKCPNCKRINEQSVKVCACGAFKPDKKEK